ncbi:hypothetical protein Scep_002835 [Stephania cephalantha]|uniref:Uncharacterized protein n=1 Tax=Stephania cephalantha TaxID=152367 RepID=A0AAP0LFU5_9MAGN
MATGTRSRRRMVSRSRRSTPYPLPSFRGKALDKETHPKKKRTKTTGKKDWEDATCSVCLEYPHNAVLLLCSSHDKGCRPYMCGTSYRYSNCLDQFKKAYTKAASPPHEHASAGSVSFPSLSPDSNWATEKCETMELACPLCRGQVKGWTVVEAARDYLNSKKRSCMQDNCSFLGTYKELRKHVKREHPSAKPREVDPVLEQKWKRLEHEREREDVMSTIRSSMPGAMVLGDYVIERSNHAFDSDSDEEGELDDDGDDDGTYDMDFDNNSVWSVLVALFGSGGRGRFNPRLRLERGFPPPINGGGRGGVPPPAATLGEAVSEGDDEDESMVPRRRGRVVGLGRAVRRRRHRTPR